MPLILVPATCRSVRAKHTIRLFLAVKLRSVGGGYRVSLSNGQKLFLCQSRKMERRLALLRRKVGLLYAPL